MAAPPEVLEVFEKEILYVNIVAKLMVVDPAASNPHIRNLTCVIRDISSLQIALANAQRFPAPPQVREWMADDRIPSLEFYHASIAFTCILSVWVRGVPPQLKKRASMPHCLQRFVRTSCIRAPRES